MLIGLNKDLHRIGSDPSLLPVAVACAEVFNGVIGRRPLLVLNGLNVSTAIHDISN